MRCVTRHFARGMDSRGVAPHRSTGLRRDLDEKSRWYVGGAAVSVAAAFLAIAIVPASIVLHL